jgi:uncharacterized protein with FMN-binding domain
MTPEKGRGSSQKVANSLVALSSAAVLTVYAAGYLRTRPAAERFAVEEARRGTSGPSSETTAAPGTTLRQSPRSPAATSVASAPPSRAVSPPATLATSDPAPTSTEVRNALPAPVTTESSTALPSAASADARATEPAAPDGNIAAEPAAAPTATQQAQYKDGTYLGWGSCRHGDIQASVVIDGGRIASASIAQCLTRYSCSWIEALPSQVVSRQNTNVDYVSGATQSTDAFADAVADALSKAK